MPPASNRYRSRPGVSSKSWMGCDTVTVSPTSSVCMNAEPPLLRGSRRTAIPQPPDCLPFSTTE